MPNRNWTFLRSHDVSDHHIFRLRHDLYRFEPSGQEQDFVVIDTASWVNVVPVTTEGNVVLIRQFRHGIQDVTMEIPGGMMDEGEAPEAAAAQGTAGGNGLCGRKNSPPGTGAAQSRRPEQLPLSLRRRRLPKHGQDAA